MRKATKILTLILVVVFALSVFAGCNLVGRNIAKYRGSEAIKIGNETVTIGKLLDTFNSYYNNYYYYISSGYLQPADLLDMVVSSLVQQYMQIDDYVSTHQALTDITELQKKVHNAEYLTKDEFAYAVKYVNYLAYNAFDQYTNDNIEAKYDLDAEEEEDTSRDFTVYDELTDMKGEPTNSYAVYTRDQNLVNEDANEYFEKNYPYLVDGTGDDEVSAKLNLDAYVYDLSVPAQKAQAEERVKSYNDRRTEDEENQLTLDEYIQILQDTKKQYEETISNSYGIDISEFLDGQLADMVSSCLLAKWSYDKYKDLENDADLKTKLQNNFEVLRDAQLADFRVSDNFDSFITSLSASSILYGDAEGKLPEAAKNYVFVKNILIPFTSTQSTLLSNLEDTVSEEAYLAKRNEYAAEIVAEYFKSDKYDESIETLFDTANTLTEKKGKTDEDESQWFTKEKVFAASGDKLVINPSGILGTWLKEDGTVSAMADKTKSETIIELMKRFNTDTAQHTAAYDYVVYVGEDWKDYSHSWVEEFYTAVNEDLVTHSEGQVSLSGKDYTLCVSTYGVHIIYLTGTVYDSDKVYNAFTYDDRLDTSTQDYQLFKTYFDTQMNLLTQDALETLQKAKLKDADYSAYIKIGSGLDKFLKDNDFEFDFDEFIQNIISEL